MQALLVSKRADGRFATTLQGAKDSPLGVDPSIDRAIGTAVREAILISRADRISVAIDVEDADGRVRRDQIVRPPLKLRRNPGASKPRSRG